MKITLPYGNEQIMVDISAPCEILTPKKIRVTNDTDIIKNALLRPRGSDSFEEFLSRARKLLVIVNDATRPTPTKKVLNYLYPFLSTHPDVKFLVATGVHRSPTKEEYHYIFGKKIFQEFNHRIFVHDARKNEDMVYLGVSQNGTEMYINKLVTETGNILVIGSVEPHYFAGFTGGRKSFLPGVASYKTIEMNHKLALADQACSLALKGNPVHEDMIDAMNVLRDLDIFSIQTVLTGDHHLYAVTAGDLFKSFDDAIKYSKEIFCVPLKKKGNIVITVAPPPMDIDLYQSQKALDNGKLALKDNGIIILVSKCPMGVGEQTFLELLGRSCTPTKVLETIKEEYRLGYHKAAKLAQMGIKAHMWAVTSLDDKIIKKALLTPKKSIQQAIDDALSMSRENNEMARVVVMPQGSLVIPMVK
jgi:nickel-dependent lactate racemase